MTKRNRILCLCLAILATAAVAFFLLYPHTTGPVLPRSGDAHIQAVELRADGELRVWSPKTEEDREKELVILDFLAESRQRHLLPNHETDWSGDASQRQYMLIVIQNGSNLVWHRTTSWEKAPSIWCSPMAACSPPEGIC